MKKHAGYISLAVAVATLVVVGLTTHLSASAASNTGNGLKISPVRSEITINPGNSQAIAVTVQNVTGAATTFQATANDFVASGNEDGQPKLILDPNQYAPSHSLKRYIAPIANVTIASGDSKTVKVTVNIPKDAAGGGYYGAVCFAPASTGSEKNVTLSASACPIILVKVPGDIKDSVVIKSFYAGQGDKPASGSSFFTTNKSLHAVIRFENDGNIQEQPFGKVTLKKGGKVLQSTEINNTDPKGNVLPDSVRRFDIDLNKVGSWGKYTLEGNFGYGANGQLVSANATFYVIPLPLILALVALVLVIIGLCIWIPRALKRYKQKIIRRAGRR